MKTSKLGRPKLPKGEAKNLVVRARMSPDEYRQVERAAKLSGQVISEWARTVMGEAASRCAGTSS